MISQTTFRLNPAAPQLSAPALRRDLPFAAASASAGAILARVLRPMQVVSPLPLADCSEAAFDEAVDFAFDRLERGFG